MKEIKTKEIKTKEIKKHHIITLPKEQSWENKATVAANLVEEGGIKGNILLEDPTIAQLAEVINILKKSHS